MTNFHFSLIVLHLALQTKAFWCAILIAHQIVMAKHGGSCVHFSGISTCGRTSPETVSHPQRQPLPTAYKISLPVQVIVTNKRLQLLATTLYNSIFFVVEKFTTFDLTSSFLCDLRSWRGRSQLRRRGGCSSLFHVPNGFAYWKHETSARCRANRIVKQFRAADVVQVQIQILYCRKYMTSVHRVYAIKCHTLTKTWLNTTEKEAMLILIEQSILMMQCS